MAKRNDILKDLKGRNKADLAKSVTEKREKLHSMHIDLAAGKVKNVREMKHIKKDIARILTFINADK